jgi:hypothetical protein
VTAELLALALANLTYLLLGCALFVAAGAVDRRRETWSRLGAAYLVGVAAVVIPASYLALLGLGVGWTLIAAVCLAAVAAAALRLRRAPEGGAGGRRTWTAGGACALVLACATLLVLAYAGRSFAVQPLLASDGWTVWAAKARLLYDHPGDAPDLLRQETYGAPSYPLGMPVLEALAFRAMGRFDGTVVDVQLLALALGFVGAVLAVTRSAARSWLAALALLAVVSAPQFLLQLGTNYADIPLALFVATGLAAAGTWLVSAARPRWLLGSFVACMGMAGLLKNEGLLFAAAAAVALLAAAWASRRDARDAAVAVTAVLAIVIPWRIYAQARGMRPGDYDLADFADPGYLADHADRVWPVVRELATELADPGRWGVLVWVVLASLVAASLMGRWLLAGFAAGWLALSLAGLVATYWISFLPLESDISNSSYRTIVTVLVGGACLVPLLLDPALDAGPTRKAND